MVPVLLYAAPFFLLFEAAQLVVAERYLGVKQLERGIDPRELGPSETVSAGWTITLFAYWAWIGAMLVPGFGRAQIVCLLLVSLIGYSLRRNCPLKWVLVILTVEGAIRIGMLVSLMAMAWRRLGSPSFL
jgi:hypothetical protein